MNKTDFCYAFPRVEAFTKIFCDIMVNYTIPEKMILPTINNHQYFYLLITILKPIATQLGKEKNSIFQQIQS